jgi:exodeoxyribonuclease V gamma subunit
MRSVPHRVVCLVGLDDGVFPRGTVTDGDDVLARDPLTGERDPRSEDRQLLLDAVMSAQETLVVTYTGANEHSGQPRPPAVPLGELLDALEATVRGAREHVVTEHPLQPFDVRNFLVDGPGPRSFDKAALAGARATTRPRTPRPPLLPDPLPFAPPAEDGSRDVSLADLRAFLTHPVRGFLRQRLDVSVPAEHEEVDDALPVEVDPLAAYAVGDRVLRNVLAGADPSGVLLAEQLRGDLPPQKLGERKLAEIIKRCQDLINASAEVRQAEASSYDVTVDLGGGRRLTGVVPDVRGHRIARVFYSALGPRQRLVAWTDLLALSAAYPDRMWRTDVYGWHSATKRARHALVGPVDHTARDLLRDLVDLHDRGLREPLPVPLKTGNAYAEAIHSHRDADRAAYYAWETSDSSPVPGEQDDAAHVRVYGRGASLRCLKEPARDDERWSNESHRLGQLALRLWEPLLEREKVF